jgi:hypothetical protein
MIVPLFEIPWLSSIGNEFLSIIREILAKVAIRLGFHHGYGKSNLKVHGFSIFGIPFILQWFMNSNFAIFPMSYWSMSFRNICLELALSTEYCIFLQSPLSFFSSLSYGI